LDRSGEIVGLVAGWIELNTKVNDKRMSADTALDKMADLRPKIDTASEAWLAASDECRAKQ
jgi:hypothetical protein